MKQHCSRNAVRREVGFDTAFEVNESINLTGPYPCMRRNTPHAQQLLACPAFLATNACVWSPMEKKIKSIGEAKWLYTYNRFNGGEMSTEKRISIQSDLWRSVSKAVTYRSEDPDTRAPPACCVFCISLSLDA